ncbi:MAG TPA: hypothetical protein DGK91_10145 [Clostridium sp.]|jgi:type VII secretion effector (TIGR04197 family)|nr:hypothetical protein [Clostridium sp.]
MGVIGINELMFLGNIGSMNAAGNAINSTIKSWTNQGEKSIALTAFAENFNMLQSIISDYKKLIQKDVANIRKVGAEIITMDIKLLKFWK